MKSTKKYKKICNKIIIGIVFAALIIAAIWFQSCFTVKDSLGESGWFLNLTKSVLEPIIGPLQVDDNGIRKMAHVIEFFILGVIVATVLTSDKMPVARFLHTNRKVLIYAFRVFICIAIVVIVACTDEFIQIFSGRGSRMGDIILDCTAGTVAILIVLIIRIIAAGVKNRWKTNEKTNDKKTINL